MNIDIGSLNRARNIALATVLAMGLSLPTTGLAYAADEDGDDGTIKVKDKLNNLFKDEVDDNSPAKSESVYVFANPDGSVKNTVVTNWLKNTTEAAKIHDISSLSDIENTEGQETFEAKGESLVWQAQGKDIYYQGNTDKNAPVELKVTYWLDGVETPAADMAGKSGHVKIRFDYKNKSFSTEYVDGAARTIYTPFMCVTGMILDNGIFKNITTKNAKAMNDGDRTLVGGYALPGLKADLDLDDDFDVPEYFEIEADVTDFEMGTTATLVSTSLMDNLNTEELDDDGLSDALNELSDGMNKLIDGSDELYKGMKKLDDGGTKLADGATELKDKTSELPESANKLAKGSADLADGADSLSDGTGQLAKGSKDLASGSSELAEGLGGAVDGSKLLQGGSSNITAALTLLRDGGTAPDGRKSGGLSAAVNALGDDGKLMGGIDAAKDGAESVTSGASTLGKGLSRLKKGSEDLLAGLKTLKSGDGEQLVGLEGAAAKLDGIDLSGLEKTAEAIKSIESAAKPLKETVPGQLQQAHADIETAKASAGSIGNAATNASTNAAAAKNAASEAQTNAETAKTDAESAQASADALSAALDGVKLDSLPAEDQKAIAKAFEDAKKAANDAASSSKTAAEAAEAAAGKATDAAGSAETAASNAGAVASGATAALTNIGTALQDTSTAATTTGNALTSIKEASSSIDVTVISAGVTQLKAGLNDAVSALGDEGTEDTLIYGANSLANGLGAAENAQDKISAGGKQIGSGLDSLKGGLQLLRDGNSEQTGLIDAVNSLGSAGDEETLIGGSAKITSSLEELNEGLSSAKGGSDKLAAGASKLAKGAKKVDSGASQVSDGADKLAGGLAQLKKSVPALAAGIEALAEGSEQLSDGIDAATKGTKKLKEGLGTFNEEGIQKIIDAYNDNIAGLADRLKVTAEAGQAYDTFTGKSDAMKGSVKFIYETDPIEINED